MGSTNTGTLSTHQDYQVIQTDGGDGHHLRIDLQTHTSYSQSCGWMSPERLVQRAERIGLNGVAITDHNTMAAVDTARRAASEDFLVISGEEIDTPEGQLIGLFLNECVEPWQSTSSVIDEIQDQGGLLLAPHPFDAMRKGHNRIDDYVTKFDAIEARNSRCIRSAYNAKAAAFADRHGLPATGGSDAHFAQELGNAWTQITVDCQSNNEEKIMLEAVKDAIRAGRVSPAGSTGSILVHAGTKAVKLYNRVKNR
jgi:predicted metal-dependent phosphoesterase TrpH